MSRVERLLASVQRSAAGLATSVDARDEWCAALARELYALALEITPPGSPLRTMARRSVRARRTAPRDVTPGNVIDFAERAAALHAKKEAT